MFVFQIVAWVFLEDALYEVETSNSVRVPFSTILLGFDGVEHLISLSKQGI